MDRAAFDAHRGAINLSVNSFFLSYLVRLHAAFEGDIEEAIVLGRVAHHNLLPWVVEAAGDAVRLEQLLRDPNSHLQRLPANAHSIALGTGIPRETVRRKLARLVAKGWLEVNDRSEFFVTPRPSDDFAGFNFELLHLFLDTADEVRRLIGEATSSRPKGRSTEG